MALKNCKECGKEVSTKADICPHCGAKNKPMEIGLGSLVLIGMLIWFVFALMEDTPPTQTAKQAPPALVNLKKDPETQKRRKKLIQKLIGQGVFYKVESPAFLPHAYVGNTFYSLAFDDKEKFVSVIFAYYYAANPKAEMVILYNHLNGKKIGTYSPALGGLDLD